MKNRYKIRLTAPIHLALCGFLLAVCVLAFQASPTAAQSFGARKMKMYLYPKQPPKVFPPKARFLLQLQPQALINQRNLHQLQERLIKTLVGYDLRFNPVFTKPDIIITCVIPELNAFSTYETHYTLEPAGEMSGDLDIKSPMGSTLQPYTLTILEGHLTVRYSAQEVATGKTLDADTLTLDFKQGYERNAPKIHDLYDLLIQKLAHLIAARFVPDFNSIEVVLPKERLKHASELLQKGCWNSAIEELTALAPMAKFADESYRLYALGIAHEGLAYETPYLNPTKEYLENALAYYDNAKRNNAAETVFLQAAARVTKLLDEYRRLEPFIKAFEKSERQKDLEASLINKIQTRCGKDGFINNNTIISMVRHGVAEKIIARHLAAVQSRYFDLSPSGMAALTKAGVKANLIDAMRESMRGLPYDGKRLRQWNQLPLDSILAVYPYLLIR
ncbi:MAG: hypothetical protein HY231_12840 [Acidobacteria bacterium]|nr:hypothetical protein [Acidobacteriota bacterium]